MSTKSQQQKFKKKNTMMSLKSIHSFFMLLAFIFTVSVAKKDDEEATAQAIRDLQMGLAGLREASSNPALLAQLMRDLQDPEMMAEAKKMMDSPEFQKQMKNMASSKEFKESLKKTSELMNDPAKAAEAEAKFEHMVKVGQAEMKQAAGGVMEDSMANPEVMAEMAKMVKDPAFQQQLADMASDPTFKSYIEAMQDMMKDPKKKAQMEKLGEAMRSAL